MLNWTVNLPEIHRLLPFGQRSGKNPRSIIQTAIREFCRSWIENFDNFCVRQALALRFPSRFGSPGDLGTNLYERTNPGR
jgi:hypothetical protein